MRVPKSGHEELFMEFLDLVKHRKSVRNFLDRPVEREKIMMCLEAARLLPLRAILSLGNS